MAQMIVKQQREKVQQPQITNPSLTKDECQCLIEMLQVLVHLTLKRMGNDTLIGLIYVSLKTHS